MKLKNPFKKEKEKKEEEQVPTYKYPLCGICQKEMTPWDKTKKFDGSRYHVSCLRKYKNRVTREFIS